MQRWLVAYTHMCLHVTSSHVPAMSYLIERVDTKPGPILMLGGMLQGEGDNAVRILTILLQYCQPSLANYFAENRQDQKK